MAVPSEFTTADLLRIFVLKFLTQDDLDNYLDGPPQLAGFLDGVTGAIEVDTTVGS